MRTAASLSLAAIIALFGCGNPLPLQDSAERLERVHASNELSAGDIMATRRMAADLNARIANARRDFEAADATYRRAQAGFQGASQGYASAARAYEVAAERFRLIAYAMILAAGYDLFLRGVCGPRVSTAAYRAELRRQGVDLEGIDIDHIWPRARGGTDRPWNYLPLEASINRSLGMNGLLWKLSHYPVATIDALAKSASHALLCLD